MRQLILDIRPDTPHTFDNFLPGPNIEAVATLQRCTQPAAAFSGEHVLYLWGEKGVGKTHLLQSWSALAHAPLFGEQASTLPETLPENMQPLWAIDDIDQLSTENQTRLFSLLNDARELGGRVVISGTLPPSQLQIRADLATRIAQGLVFRLLPLTDSDKRQAINLRAEARGMQLNDDILRHLLTHCRRDLPHLLKTVDDLDTLSLSRKRPPTVVLLRKMLQDRTAH